MLKKSYYVIGIVVLCALVVGLYLGQVIMNEKSFENQENSKISGATIKDFSVIYINAGKADCIMIKANGHTFLIDTGLKQSYHTIQKVLNKYDVEKLDAVFLTHQHKDHIGGLKKIAEKYPISKVYASSIAMKGKDGLSKIDNVTQKLNLPLEKLSYGDQVKLVEDLYFDVIGPTIYNVEDDNDNSLVLRLDVNGKRFLFTGDMQWAEEKALMTEKVDVSADIYKVSNHGNPDSTLKEFARKVSPQIAIVTTDTNIDRDSANRTILSFFHKAKIYKTQDYDLGVLVEIDEKSNVTVREA